MSDSRVNFFEQFQDNLTSPMMALWTKIAEFLPNLLAAVILIAFGWVIAKSVALLISTALSKVGVDRLGDQSGLQEMLSATSLKQKEPSAILGLVAFWLVMLTFVMSAADALGLPQVSATMDKFVFYLPKVLAASVVLLVGLFIAQFVRAGVLTLASGMQTTHAKTVSSIVHGFLVVLISTLAIAQLDINVELLNNVISIALISLGAGLALALGLGGKDIARDLLESLYKDGTSKTKAKATPKATPKPKPEK